MDLRAKEVIMIESVTKAAVGLGAVMGLVTIASGNHQAGAIVLIVSLFAWLVCWHIDKCALAYNAMLKREEAPGNTRKFGSGFMGAPGKSDDVVALANVKIDKQLAEIKTAFLDSRDGDKAIRVMLGTVAQMITPILTYPGHKILNPKNRKQVAPAEAADMVVENFRYIITGMVKEVAQGVEKGTFPGSVEELEKRWGKDK